jgi:two-component system chemotaxis response regulator CheB
MYASIARSHDVELIVLGASRGGTQALQAVLSALPPDFATPIVIVLHRRAGAEGRLVHVLQTHCALPVVEVTDKDALRAGHVFIAPAEYHLLVEPGGFALSTDAPVNYARPSIDVLFESAARTYGPGVLGVILTGGNHDGAQGLAAIRARGGVVVVQEPSSASSEIMPTAALATGPVHHVFALEKIGPLLVRATQGVAV